MFDRLFDLAPYVASDSTAQRFFRLQLKCYGTPAWICAAFQDVLRSSGIKPLALPPRSPNLNAFSERWVRSIKQECLSKLILFGEPSLRRVLSEFIDHYHFERNHQG